MEKSQEIIHPRVASMEQIKLSVWQSLNEILQINRRCVIHGAKSRMNLNHQAMFSRQSADVVNHVFIEVPVSCFCGVLLAIGDGSTAMMIAGIAVGILGMAGMGANFPIYRKILARGKQKYAYEIIELAREISEEK